MNRRGFLKSIGALGAAPYITTAAGIFPSWAFAAGPTPTGSGRFVPFDPSFSAGSPFPAVRLFPFNGNIITIGGVQHQIPAPGVDLIYNNCIIDGVPNQTLAGQTNYYVHAFVDYGPLTPVMRLEASTTGWRTDDNGAQAGHFGNGVAIKGGDPSRSVVGILRTNPEGKWKCDDKSQNTASFYNRVRIGVKCQVIDCYTSPTSGMWVEPNSDNRINFVCWQDDLPEITLSGTMTNNTMYGHNEVAIHVDGSNPPGSSIAVWDCLSANSSTPFCIKSSSDGGTIEGYHYFGILMKVNAGTGYLRAGYPGAPWGSTQLIASPVPS